MAGDLSLPFVPEDDQEKLSAARERAAKVFPEEQRAKIAHAFSGYSGPEISGAGCNPKKDSPKKNKF